MRARACARPASACWVCWICAFSRSTAGMSRDARAERERTLAQVGLLPPRVHDLTECELTGTHAQALDVADPCARHALGSRQTSEGGGEGGVPARRRVPRWRRRSGAALGAQAPAAA